VIAALAFLLSAQALAAPATKAAPVRPAPARKGDLGLITNYQLTRDVLTTDKISDLDPNEVNPHRQRWILERNVKLRGLKADLRPDGLYSVHAEAVEANTRGWIRPAGPWFRPLADFPCTSEPDPAFATAEGAEHAAQAGAEAWVSVLSAARDQLRIKLSRVQAPGAALALADAKQVLSDWVNEADRDWRERGRKLAREQEWQVYGEQAGAKGLCKGAQKPKPAPFAWRDQMEAVPLGPPMFKVLARAPARRWNGMYSIRLTAHVGATRALSGQFLIDTGAPKTIFSPEWLKGQGVLGAWIEIPRAAPERAVFSAGRGVARRASIDSIEFGGLKIGLGEVLLYETELFTPPENLASCCDGVIGMDVLRRYVLELRPGPPAEVVLWPREGFRAPYADKSVWLESGLTPDLAPVSEACTSSPIGAREEHSIGGLSWDTGNEGDLDVHLPWASKVKGRNEAWSVHCGDGVELTARVYPDVPKEGEARAANEMLLSRSPGATAGMALLGRGSVTFDFPHGRIWFPQPALELPVRENHTGLTLVFDYAEGERVLKVASVRPNALIKPLLQAGLQPGDQVLEVDKRPADEADLWEIDQRLGGAYGSSVELKWKSAGKVNQARINL
jgi:hypothetical protein